MTHRLRGRHVIVAAAALLCLTACSNTSTASTAESSTATSTAAPAPPANAPALEKTYVEVVNKVLPSVVQITTQAGLGSGIVYDSAGHIVTNNHVVGNATTFQVRLPDNPAPVPATLVGAYPPDDLAVIKLDNPPPTLHPAAFGKSSQLQVGDIVLAMGNPLGLTGSVTEGIVSAVGRTVSEPTTNGSPGATLPDVVQTSAAINPGNSGGALVNLAGEVVGVPTLAAVDPQIGNGGSAAPGLGFAIPSDIVTDIAGQIVKTGHVTNSHRAALGVGVITVVGQNGQPAGAGVGQVDPNGAAAKAGIKVGDVITGIANQPVNSAQQLTQVLATLDPGASVPVQLNGSRTVTVTLGQLPGT